MTRWYELSVPPDVRYVGVARSTVLTAAATTRLDPDRVEDLRTCVSEAVTNAVTAHLRAGEARDVEVRIGCDDQQVIVEIHDHGPGLPAALALPPVEALDDDDIPVMTEGGYGLPVMRALADQVELLDRGAEAGTIVRLRFAQPSTADI